MGMTTLLLQILGLVWLASEIALNLFKRARRGDAIVQDRSSITVLWGMVGVAFLAAILGQTVSSMRITTIPLPWLHGAGIVLLIAGMWIRLLAVRTLGRFFDTSVAIQGDHRVVSAGVFRFVRHPSYSGLLLAFLGISLMFSNWLSIVALLVPILPALLYRIRVEEKAMLSALGQDYREYQQSTRRLIPGIY
jgi:protein-S-isoprenylcysteine O-methyltransferase Ste14